MAVFLIGFLIAALIFREAEILLLLSEDEDEEKK